MLICYPPSYFPVQCVNPLPTACSDAVDFRNFGDTVIGYSDAQRFTLWFHPPSIAHVARLLDTITEPCCFLLLVFLSSCRNVVPVILKQKCQIGPVERQRQAAGQAPSQRKRGSLGPARPGRQGPRNSKRLVSITRTTGKYGGCCCVRSQNRCGLCSVPSRSPCSSTS